LFFCVAHLFDDADDLLCDKTNHLENLEPLPGLDATESRRSVDLLVPPAVGHHHVDGLDHHIDGVRARYRKAALRKSVHSLNLAIGISLASANSIADRTVLDWMR
jgi:hypothetical protein